MREQMVDRGGREFGKESQKDKRRGSCSRENSFFKRGARGSRKGGGSTVFLPLRREKERILKSCSRRVRRKVFTTLARSVGEEVGSYVMEKSLVGRRGKIGSREKEIYRGGVHTTKKKGGSSSEGKKAGRKVKISAE